MINTELTKLALSLATKLHSGQVDKGGQPYIEHPKAIAEQMPDEATTVTALLHDVLEDTDATPASLISDGIPEDIVRHIQALTRPTGKTYMEYIRDVAGDSVACQVKMADLWHNMDLRRLGREPNDSDLSRLRRYKKAMEYLENYSDLDLNKI